VMNASPKRTVPALEIVDDGATALPVRGSMVRIGRHEENDICLSSKSVHRYHAVMQLTGDQEYTITDISGLDGNGVFVNAERIDNTTLQNGDLIELGDVKLRFRLNELH
jgi:pSer/pThr/pTyr-binding forkhead associated (FHA) protein